MAHSIQSSNPSVWKLIDEQMHKQLPRNSTSKSQEMDAYISTSAGSFSIFQDNYSLRTTTANFSCFFFRIPVCFEVEVLTLNQQKGATSIKLLTSSHVFWCTRWFHWFVIGTLLLSSKNVHRSIGFFVTFCLLNSSLYLWKWSVFDFLSHFLCLDNHVFVLPCYLVHFSFSFCKVRHNTDGRKYNQYTLESVFMQPNLRISV